MHTILVVEDEIPIAMLIRAYLEKAGYRVLQAADGEEALSGFAESRPDLVLLDIMLPGRDGWEVLEEIRRQGSCPVIVITARGSVEDRLKGFSRGADDYVSKPFDPNEVVARVQAVLRRPARLIDQEVFSAGSLTVNFTSRTAFLRGCQLPLAPRDWDLLAFLVRNPNRAFTRDHLLDKVWGIDYEGGDRAVDLSVKRLRQAMRDWPPGEGEIVTIRGMGYMLRVEERKPLQ